MGAVSATYMSRMPLLRTHIPCAPIKLTITIKIVQDPSAITILERMFREAIFMEPITRRFQASDKAPHAA